MLRNKRDAITTKPTVISSRASRRRPPVASELAAGRVRRLAWHAGACAASIISGLSQAGARCFRCLNMPARSRTLLAALLVACAGRTAIGFSRPVVAGPCRAAAALPARRRPPVHSAAMSSAIFGWFDALFGSGTKDTSQPPKAKAVSRLNVMLASDRAALDQETLFKIREGIIELVQKYVEIQPDDVILNVATEERKSILTASLAIKGRRVPMTTLELVAETPEEAETPVAVGANGNTPLPPPPPPQQLP